MRSAWALAGSVAAVAANCVWPCWQMSAVALMFAALWLDENWETLINFGKHFGRD